MCTLQPENGGEKRLLPRERIITSSPADPGNFLVRENAQHFHAACDDPLAEHLRTGLIPVETALEMRDAVMNNITGADVFIGVSD